MNTRLERSVRAIAWLALTATVATLLGMAIWLRPPTMDGSLQAPPSHLSEGSPLPQPERTSAAP